LQPLRQPDDGKRLAVARGKLANLRHALGARPGERHTEWNHQRTVLIVLEQGGTAILE